MNGFITEICNSALFRGVERMQTERLIKQFGISARNFKCGETIFSAGDVTERFGIMLGGSAYVYQDDFWGNRNFISVISGGQLFAESFSVLENIPLNVTVTAAEDSSVCFVSAGAVLQSGNAVVIKNLLNDIARKNLRLNEKLTHMSRRTTRQKLLSFLSTQAAKHGGNEFEISFNRQQLADYLGVDRSAMSAELSALKKEGCISYSRSKFKLY